MKLQPVITEKSMKEAKRGRYTFLVEKNLSKPKIKKLVEDVFSVEVAAVATLKVPGEKRRTYQGRYRIRQPKKKAVVTLKEKQKIDLFEESQK